jgi:beta-phosphoglucomutase-like phosphatase (HAD superfamily)
MSSEEIVEEEVAVAAEEAVEQEVLAEEEPVQKHAVIFELENLVGNARLAAFDVLKGILNEKNMEFEAPLFSRYCLYSKPEYYVEQVQEAVGAKKLSTRKLIEDVENGIGLHLTSSNVEVPAGLKKIIQYAFDKDIVVAAVSSLSQNVYKSLLAKLGLEEQGIRMFHFAEVDRNFPRADAWLRVAKELELDPRNCLVLGTSQYSCKSALTAGMRCAAVPDSLTCFQDYGGAYTIIDEIDEVDPATLFEYID